MLISDLIAHLNRTIDKEGDLELTTKSIMYGQILPLKQGNLDLILISDNAAKNPQSFLQSAFSPKYKLINPRKVLLINQ